MTSTREIIKALEKRIQDMIRVYPSFPPPWFTEELRAANKALEAAKQRQAIREEALEEAAKMCEAYIDLIEEIRDNDDSLPMYLPELAGRQAGASRCIALIRGLK